MVHLCVLRSRSIMQCTMVLHLLQPFHSRQPLGSKHQPHHSSSSSSSSRAAYTTP
jgi:hypothetical protein